MMDGATIYELTVTLLDGTLVATYTYNALGELINAVFHAPARTMQKAIQFVVSGLESGQKYNYQVVTKDNNEDIIDTKEGTFETNSQQTTAFEEVESSVKCNEPTKLVRQGNVYILTSDKTYTITGAEVK